MNTLMFTYEHMWKIQRPTFRVFFLYRLTLFFLKAESLAELDAHCLGLTGWPASPRDLCFCLLVLGYRYVPLCLALIKGKEVGSGDLNSGPHVRTAVTLPSEPSSQPILYIKKKKKEKKRKSKLFCNNIVFFYMNDIYITMLKDNTIFILLNTPATSNYVKGTNEILRFQRCVCLAFF